MDSQTFSVTVCMLSDQISVAVHPEWTVADLRVAIASEHGVGSEKSYITLLDGSSLDDGTKMSTLPEVRTVVMVRSAKQDCSDCAGSGRCQRVVGAWQCNGTGSYAGEPFDSYSLCGEIV